jgi:hypothetical protein
MDFYRVKTFSIPKQETLFVASQMVTGKGMKMESSKVQKYYFTLLQLVLRPYQIFCEIGGLEQDPLSLLRTIEELLE